MRTKWRYDRYSLGHVILMEVHRFPSTRLRLNWHEVELKLILKSCLYSVYTKFIRHDVTDRLSVSTLCIYVVLTSAHAQYTFTLVVPQVEGGSSESSNFTPNVCPRLRCHMEGGRWSSLYMLYQTRAVCYYLC
jgi:hypothetical protein